MPFVWNTCRTSENIYHFRTTISRFLEIFQMYGILFLGFWRIKFSLYRTLGPLNFMPSLWVSPFFVIFQIWAMLSIFRKAQLVGNSKKKMKNGPEEITIEFLEVRWVPQRLKLNSKVHGLLKSISLSSSLEKHNVF